MLRADHLSGMTSRRILLGALSTLGTAGLTGCLATFTPSDASGDTGNEGDGGGSDDPRNSPDVGGGDVRADDPDAPSTSDGPDDAGDADGGDLPVDGDADGSDGTRPRGTGGPGLSIAGQDPQPDLPLEVAVEVTRDVATDQHPPGLRVSLTNTGDDLVGVGEGRAVVFAYRTSTDRALTLLPAEFDAPAKPGCWRLTDGVAVTEEYRITRIEPHETVSQTLSLYASHDGTTEPDACLPVGEHRFESAYSVHPDAETPETSQRATWGFSVLLE